MNCSNCNTNNPDNAKYCSNCGNPLAPQGKQSQSSQNVGLKGYEGPTGPNIIWPRVSGMEGLEYAAILHRAGAWIVDFTIVLVLVIIIEALLPLGFMIYFIEPSYHVLFIGLRGQTPGKMVFGVLVVKPGREVPGIGTAILREVPGKFLSGIVLGLGYAWALWDPRKQTWHDKAARTYVFRTRSVFYKPPP